MQDSRPEKLQALHAQTEHKQAVRSWNASKRRILRNADALRLSRIINRNEASKAQRRLDAVLDRAIRRVEQRGLVVAADEEQALRTTIEEARLEAVEWLRIRRFV